MSGTGKSSALVELRNRGFRTVDTDEGGWSEWRDDGVYWREDRMEKLLAEEADVPLFVSGTVTNQGRFYPRFDAVVLLSAPVDVLQAINKRASKSQKRIGPTWPQFCRLTKRGNSVRQVPLRIGQLSSGAFGFSVDPVQVAFAITQRRPQLLIIGREDDGPCQRDLRFALAPRRSVLPVRQTRAARFGQSACGAGVGHHGQMADHLPGARSIVTTSGRDDPSDGTRW